MTWLAVAGVGGIGGMVGSTQGGADGVGSTVGVLDVVVDVGLLGRVEGVALDDVEPVGSTVGLVLGLPVAVTVGLPVGLAAALAAASHAACACLRAVRAFCRSRTAAADADGYASSTALSMIRSCAGAVVNQLGHTSGGPATGTNVPLMEVEVAAPMQRLLAVRPLTGAAK
jgi:hypothetical protein